MLSSLSHPEVDTACFSCSSPNLNSSKRNPWLWRPKLSFHLTKPLFHATTSINCGFLSYSLPKVNPLNTNISLQTYRHTYMSFHFINPHEPLDFGYETCPQDLTNINRYTQNKNLCIYS